METAVSIDSESRVALPQGVLRGGVAATPAGPCLAFRSIPYAAAPVGALRFQPPRPPVPWAGERDACRPGPVLPQPPSRLVNVMGPLDFEQAEGALTLTVWTPSTQGRRAVVVWLHGGAFATGGGDLAWYDGSRLAAEQGIVVVAVNYRLGALGFLRAPGVCEGNLGLLDQEAALAWVRQYIEAFGGDPSQVAVMGQSAGGISIAHHLARSSWWARRAIILSGPLSLDPQPVESAERTGAVFLRALGIDDPSAPDALVRAQAAPIGAILAAQGEAARFHVSQLGSPLDVSPPFVPVADGAVLGLPGEFAARRSQAATRVDVMIGTTREECNAFFADDPRLAALDALPPEVRDAAYWQARRPGAGVLQWLSDYGTWAHFEGATLGFARDAAQAGRKAFLYRFDWAPPGSRYAAAHCIELPFVFGTHEVYGDAAMLRGADPRGMHALAATIRAAVGAFVREGDPAAGSGLPSWPACRADRLVRMRWDEVCEATTIEPDGAIGAARPPADTHAAARREEPAR